MRLGSKRERAFFLALMLLIAAGMGVIIFPVARFIVLGGIVGVLLVPVRRWVLRWVPSRAGLASGLVYVVFIAVVAIPLILVLTLSGDQAGNIAEAAGSPAADRQTQALLGRVAEAIGGDATLLVEIGIWLRESVAQVFAAIAEQVASLVGTAVRLFTSFLLFSFFTVVFMHEYQSLRDLLIRLAPLPTTVTTAYLHKTRLMARSVVVGVFGVAAVQTAIMTATFTLVKVPNALAYLIPLFLFSLIPFLGMSLITIPMGVVLLLQGQWVAAIVIWLVHLFVINGVDIVMRPYVISGEVKVNRALLATSFFGGIAVFGLLGLFIGPIMTIIFTLSLEIYQGNFVEAPTS
jgi:predicted PurR-regulated permease PerM